MAVPQHAKGDKPNLLGMTLPEMTTFFAELGEKPFRAKQVFRWIHHFGVDNFEAMTDLAKSLREKLPAVAVIVPAPQVPVRPFGVEITRPAGSVSLKPTPVRAVVVLLFWMVKVSEVEPFSGMLALKQFPHHAKNVPTLL